MPRTRTSCRGSRASRARASRDTRGSHNGPTTDIPPIAPHPATTIRGRVRDGGQTAGGSQASRQGGLLAKVNNELHSLIRDEI